MQRIWNFRFDRHGSTQHYRLFRRECRALLVLFPALRALGQNNVQYYNRLTLFDDLPCSRLYIADPVLTRQSYPRGSWFQGTRQHFALPAVARDIQAICEEFRFDETRVVGYGSSMGGFAALGLGAFLPHLRILAEAPQTELRDYEVRKDTDAMALACYGVASVDEIPAEFDHRLSIARLWRRHGVALDATIAVKRSDLHHVQAHLEPLLAARDVAGKVTAELMEDFGTPGHTPLPHDWLETRLAEMLERPAPGRIKALSASFFRSSRAEAP